MTRPKSHVPPPSRQISVARKAVCVAARALVDAPGGAAKMAAERDLFDAVNNLADLDPIEYREES